VPDDLGEEIRQHLEQKTEQLMREGKPRVEAEREAKIAFGNATLIREQGHEVWQWPFSSVLGDLRYALRLFSKSPGFALAITLTLTLGIGANFAVFNTLYSLLLESLPVHEPGRLVHLALRSREGGPFGISDAPINLNLPIMELIQQGAHSFRGVLGWYGQDYPIAEGIAQRTTPGALLTGNAFSVLGLKPAAGRLLEPQDDQPGGGAGGWAVVISYRFWQAHYGGSEAAVGSKLRISGLTATVVGVAPRGFDSVLLDNHPSVYLPMEFKAAVDGPHTNLHQSGVLWLTCLARLRPGISQMQAAAEMNALWPGILDATTAPKMRHLRFVEGLRFQVLPGRTGWSYLRLAYAKPLKVLQVLVAVVFLLCCTNIGGLCVARAIARKQEFETRSALGAGRARLVRQVLMESLTLAFPGALIAVLFAWGADQVLMPMTGAYGMQIAPRFTAWIWVGILPVACLSSMLFGLFPAMLVSKFAQQTGNPGIARTGVGAFERRAAWFYLPVQIAMSLILVFAAGLFTATLSHLRHDNLGFETAGVYLTTLDFGKAPLSADDKLRLERRLTGTLVGEPGVFAASMAMNTPLNGSLASNEFAALQDAAARPVTLDTNDVGSGYFKAMGTPLLRGREFGDQRASECIVNQSAARRLFSRPSPVGQTLRVFENQLNGDVHRSDCLIVGEVGDAKYDTLREIPPATVYRAWGSTARDPANPVLVIRAVSIRAAKEAFAKAMSEVAPQATQNEVIAFAEQVDGSVQRERMLVVLSNFFAILALAISAVGVFGVTAWTATRRTREIGVRSALGATRRNITRTFLVEAVRTAAVGSIAGTVAALLTTKWVNSLLYGIRPGDPALLLASIGVLGAVVLLAAYLPARRAASIDPMQALRQE
jgi:predicted permease